MADQNQTVEIPLLLENVLRYSLNQARDRMLNGEEILPVTALAVGDTLFMEEKDAETAQDAFAAARATVANAQGAKTYGFIYDGYVDLATGRADALIAQGGMPGEPYGHAIGLIYKVDKEGNITFHKEPIYVGPCQNYMLSLMPFDTPEEEKADEASGEEDGSEAAE